MEKPVINSFNAIAPLVIQTYEHYLPTAFDDSMTMLQKVNKCVQYASEIGALTQNVLTEWNKVMEWVMGDGLTQATSEKLEEFATDGTLEALINVHIFEDLKAQINEKSISVLSYYTIGMDWADAINNAINASNVGDTIIFPKGTVEIGKTIYLKPNRSYLGHFWGSAIKVKANANLLYAIALMDTGSFNDHVIVKNLFVDGNKAQNNLYGHGLYLQSMQNCLLERVKVVNTKQTGFYLDGAEGRMANTVHIIECRTLACDGYGLFLSPYTQDMHVIGGDYGMSKAENVFVNSPSSSVRNATVWASMMNGIKIEKNTPNVQVWACQVEGNAMNGIEVRSSFAFINGNKVYDNANVPANYGKFDGIVVMGEPTAYIEGVHVTGNQIFSGLYDGTGYHRYAIAFDDYHNHCHVSANEVKFQGNGVIDNSRPFVNGLKATDYCDYSWNRSGVFAYPNATQNIVSDGTYKKVTFGAEAYDYEAEFSGSSFTAKDVGLYDVNVQLTFAQLPAGMTGTNLAYLSLHVNGVEKFRLDTALLTASEFASLSGNKTVSLAKGDVVEIKVMTEYALTVLADSALSNVLINRLRL